MCPGEIATSCTAVPCPICHMCQVRVDDAELLTEWQRRNAEFKQRKKIAGAMGAADKAQRMKAFQMRLRVGKSAAAEAAAAAAASTTDGAAAGDEVNTFAGSALTVHAMKPAFAGMIKPHRLLQLHYTGCSSVSGSGLADAELILTMSVWLWTC